jgi:recombinational DNA repair ATPase RecF
LKIQTLLISNFKGSKSFRIENMPNFVHLVGGNGVGKSSRLQAISCLKQKMISPNVEPNASELVYEGSNSCNTSAVFHLAQSEIDYLQGTCHRNDIGVEHFTYVELNRRGEV